MSSDLELALKVKASVEQAVAALTSVSDQLKGLGPAGDAAGEGGAQASAGLDAVSGSADAAAASVKKASDAMAASAAKAAASTAASTAAMVESEEQANARLSAMVERSMAEDAAVRAGASARAAASAQSTAATLEEVRARQRLIEAQDRMTPSLTAYIEEQRAARNAELEGAGAAEVEAGALNRLHLASGGATREYSALLDEMLSGRTRRIPATLSVLASRVGAAKYIFSGMGAAVIASVGALGLFTAALIKGEKEDSAFNAVVATTGGYLGMTRGQFRQAEVGITGLAVTIGTAKDAMMAAAETGQFTGETLVAVGRGAAAMSELTGQSVKDSVAEFAKLGEDPVKAILKLNDQYHFLTASVYSQIAALQEEGDREGAVKLAVQTLSQAQEQRAQDVVKNKGIILSAIDDEKRGWSELWDKILGVGRQQTPEEKLAAVQAQIMEANQNLYSKSAGRGRWLGAAGYVPASNAGARKHLDDLLATAKALQAQIDAAHKAAAATAKLDKEQQGYVEAAADIKAMNAQLDKSAALQSELNKLAEDKKHLQALASDKNAKPADRAAAQTLLDTTHWDTLEQGIRAKYRQFASAMIALDKQELQQMEAQDQVSQKDRVAYELAFWQKKLDAERKGTTAYAALYQQVMKLKGEQEKAQSEAKLHEIDAEVAATRRGSQQRVDALQKEVAYAKQAFGEESTEYQNAVSKMNAAILAHEQLVRKIDALQIESEKSAGLYQVALSEQILKQKRALNQVGATEEMQQLVKLENQKYQIELQALQRKMELESKDRLAVQQTQNQIQQLTQQHQLKLQQITDQTTLNVRQKWIGIMSPITSAFQTAINGMIQGTETLRQAIGNVALGIVGDFVSMGLRMLVSWVATHIAMKTTAAATAAETLGIQGAAAAAGHTKLVAANVAAIMSDAAAAAAGAAASVSMIPYVGWIMAPEVAAATYASTAAYAGLASAAGGWWEIPSDQIAQVHKHEMVLPAREAQGVRDMVNRGRAGGGDTFVIQAMDAQSFHTYLKRNAPLVTAVIKSQARDFAFGAPA